MDLPATRLMNALDKTNVYARAGRRAVHKPLLVLLAMRSVAQGDGGVLQYRTTEPELEELIREFSNTAKNSSAPRAHYPFWYLKNEPFWFVADEATLQPRKGKGAWGEPSVRVMRDSNVEAGFVPQAANLLDGDAHLFASALEVVLDRSFPETRQNDVLEAVGIQPRRPPAKRDPLFRGEVLREYGWRCAVCGFDGRLGAASVGLEAAHINGIALCALHHKLFDAGAITFEPQSFDLRVSSRFAGLSSHIGGLLNGEARISVPVRPSSHPSTDFLSWHAKNVFVS
jgi:putative restriction endonuclease